ncbi:hypothetical protein QBC39DRAFT_348711 [Podospora conica]|nr:hypothetical protein QBC39DRAFT_348711 [Schizothecium conicum]
MFAQQPYTMTTPHRRTLGGSSSAQRRPGVGLCYFASIFIRLRGSGSFSGMVFGAILDGYGVEAIYLYLYIHTLLRCVCLLFVYCFTDLS